MLQPELSGDFASIMEWADKARRMKVRTNAETPADARMARSFGAEGIGLCRTEHMFFDGDRIIAMREMILAENEKGRRAALDKLLPMQRSDFVELFEIMAGLPVTIRLLDPPLHEFLPKTEKEFEEVAAVLNVSADRLRQRTEALHEFNPMLGHRGCRLAVSYPEIAEMQTRAIFEAAIEAAKTTGSPVVPEIMVPLVGMKKELDYVKARIDAVAKSVMAESGTTVEYLTGTMIELPRAAIRAHVIAESGGVLLLRHQRSDPDDVRHQPRRRRTLPRDLPPEGHHRPGPVRIDRCRRRRRTGEPRRRKRPETRPGIKLGICGEHGGDPASIHFCEKVGLDYVSCSPYRVPIAQAGGGAGGGEEGVGSALAIPFSARAYYSFSPNLNPSNAAIFRPPDCIGSLEIEEVVSLEVSNEI